MNRLKQLPHLIRLGLSVLRFLKIYARIAWPRCLEDAMAAALARIPKIMLRNLHSICEPNTPRVAPYHLYNVSYVRHETKLDTIIDTVNV